METYLDSDFTQAFPKPQVTVKICLWNSWFACN